MKLSILKVSPMIFVEICKHGARNIRIIGNRIPLDAKYVRSFTNDDTGWGYISIVLESESFKDLQDGELIPELPKPMFENYMENENDSRSKRDI